VGGLFPQDDAPPAFSSQTRFLKFSSELVSLDGDGRFLVRIFLPRHTQGVFAKPLSPFFPERMDKSR